MSPLSAFRKRHPLLTLALPLPSGSPLERAARGLDANWNAAEAALTAGHEDIAALMHSARSLGGELAQQQLQHLWPEAGAHDLALAKGLGVALWLAEMLLFLREDAAGGRILPPRDAMRRFMVEESQIHEGRHDFALRRLAGHLAEQAIKILQGSAPLGLSAPLLLRLRLRWAMLYTGFLLEAMRRDPDAPFIHPRLPPREFLRLLGRALSPDSRGKNKGGGCSG
ncbi:squalene/phytoene synthase family protein [Thiofaba sp. EF100]|uniref:squalene/phytoene synthase family protein n=1 Tax=Thiofaba sp. EF100 TaxID=3121274 RepID=UPI0032218429